MSPVTPPEFAMGRFVAAVRPLRRERASLTPADPTFLAGLPLGRYLALACGAAGVLLGLSVYFAARPGADASAAEAPATLAVVEPERDHAEGLPAERKPHAAGLEAEAAPPAAGDREFTLAPHVAGEAEAREMAAVHRALTLPTPPAAVVKPALPPSAAVRVEPARKFDCTKLGTRIVFYRDPPDAFAMAREENKLVFFMHLSGNFEDDAFT